MEDSDRGTTAKPETYSSINTPYEGEFDIQSNYLKKILEMDLGGT